MERQPFCSLPWCGKTGKIDMHHVIPRSQGGSDDDDNLVAICHSCHMRHHGEQHIMFHREGDSWHAALPGMAFAPLVIYDECRDADYPTTEERLGKLADEMREKKRLADQLDYLLSLDLADASKMLDRSELITWTADNLNVAEQSAGSYITKRVAYATLPEECATLGIANGYRVYRLAQEHDLATVLSDFGSMSRSHFLAKYGITTTKKKHACPDCGQAHSIKGE